jgi:hypothetical protein
VATNTCGGANVHITGVADNLTKAKSLATIDSPTDWNDVTIFTSSLPPCSIQQYLFPG